MERTRTPGGSSRVSLPDPSELLRQLLHGGSAPETPQCLDDDTIAAVAEGGLEARARSEAVAHLATCPRCRRAVASVVTLLSDSDVAREVNSINRSGRRRFVRIFVPAAAAAVLLVAIGLSRRFENDGSGHRGPPKPATAPVPVSPVGTVANARVLQWTSIPGADRYRVTVSDAGGRVLYETQVGDTAVTLPDSIKFVSGRSYVWIVEARTGIDRWSTSRLVEFSIGSSAR